MHVGKAHEEITGGGCGLFDLASLDEGDRNVEAAVSSSSSSGTAAAPLAEISEVANRPIIRKAMPYFASPCRCLRPNDLPLFVLGVAA
jgi:hypothetical protein